MSSQKDNRRKQTTIEPDSLAEIWANLQKTIDSAEEEGDVLAAYINAVATRLRFGHIQFLYNDTGMEGIFIGSKALRDTVEDELGDVFSIEEMERNEADFN